MGCFVTHPTVGHIVGINEMITDPAFKSRIPGNAELQLGLKQVHCDSRRFTFPAYPITAIHG